MSVHTTADHPSASPPPISKTNDPTPQPGKASPSPSIKGWKDRGEYDLYASILEEGDPDNELRLLNTWEQKYPNTDFVEELLLLHRRWDPVGDARVDERISISPDLVYASGSIVDSNLILKVQFAPGTFSRRTTDFGFLLDVDLNPSTGAPGTTKAAVADLGLIGSEYYLEFRPSPPNYNVAVLHKFTPKFTPGTDIPAVVGSYPVTFRPNGAEITIPMAALNNSDGNISFKVLAQSMVSTFGSTGVLDYLPDVGVPAIKVQPPSRQFTVRWQTVNEVTSDKYAPESLPLMVKLECNEKTVQRGGSVLLTARVTNRSLDDVLFEWRTTAGWLRTDGPMTTLETSLLETGAVPLEVTVTVTVTDVEGRVHSDSVSIRVM